jgi:hypothetical protein
MSTKKDLALDMLKKWWVSTDDDTHRLITRNEGVSYNGFLFYISGEHNSGVHARNPDFTILNYIISIDDILCGDQNALMNHLNKVLTS